MRTPAPPELSWARTVLALCDRFHKLPSEVLAEPADVLRMLALASDDCGKAEE